VALLAFVGLVVLGVLVIVGTPLVLRGPLLAGFAVRTLPATCGRVEIGSASLSTFAIVDLILERPFDLELRRLGITDPAGRKVLDVDTVTARVRLERAPMRVDILEARVGPGDWKMLGDKRYGFSLAAAFAPAATCGAPKPPPAPAKHGGAGFALRVEHVELADLTAVFDFPDWAVTLSHAHAHGGLSVGPGPAGKPVLAFDVQDVRAGNGSVLRVGKPGRAGYTAQVPFDDVSMPLIATDPQQPADLRLVVERAATRRAVLSGKAEFHAVFAKARGGPGMDLDASWTNFADAAAELQAQWRPIVSRVMGTEELDLSAKVHGPFTGVAADLEARAAAIQLALSVQRDLSARAALTLHDYDVASRLPASLRPLLGGKANGHMRIEAQLGPALERVSGTLADMDLSLERTRPGPFPRRWRLHKSAAAPVATGQRATALDVTIGSAGLEHGVLALDGVGVAVAGGTIRGGAKATLIEPGSSRPLTDPIVDEKLSFDGIDLGLLVKPMSGVAVSGTVEARGPTNDLAMEVRFGGQRLVVFNGIPVTLPQRIDARLRHGDTLTVPPFVFTGPAGGTMEVRGVLVFDERLDAKVAVRRWPIAATWLPERLPRSGVWRGALDGQVTAKGPLALPVIKGELDLHDVVAAGVPIGEGQVIMASHGRELGLSARLGPHVIGEGKMRLVPRTMVRATALLTQLPLDPVLTRLSPQASGTVTGELDLALDERKLSGEARLTEVRLGYGRAVVANRDVLRVRGGPGDVTVDPCRFEGSGLAFSVGGRLEGDSLQGAASGNAELGPLLALLPPSPVPVARAAGQLAFDARASGQLRAPTIDIQASVREPLTGVVVPARNLELPVTVSSGEVTWHGPAGEPPRVRVERLALSTPGARAEVAGEAAVDLHEPEASPGSWRASVDVDAAALARLVPKQLAHAEGRLTVAARLEGAPRSGRWEGTVDSSPVVLVPRGAQASLSFTPLHAGFASDAPLRIAPFEMSLGDSGRIALGAPEQPALLEIRTFDPLEVGRLEVGLRGSGITLPQPVAGIRIEGADFDLHLVGPGPEGRFLLSGLVTVPRAEYVGKPKETAQAPSKNSALTRFTKRLWLDLHVRVPEFGVSAPGPDLAVAVDCRVQGPLSSPTTSGSLRGRTLYSRAALFVADLFRGSHLRDCRK
jgi:hypothetical protein